MKEPFEKLTECNCGAIYPSEIWDQCPECGFIDRTICTQKEIDYGKERM